MNPGDDNWRAYVGPPRQYDFMGASQFRLLTMLGLREEHHLIDIGCGSLRLGRFAIPYLLPGRYLGVEPNAWLWRTALEEELGADIARLRQPRFSEDADFGLADAGDGSADYIIAQSIYSHTGQDALATSLHAAARVLAPQGQFLFTIVTPECAGTGGMKRGAEAQGWVYPACTVFDADSVASACTDAGLQVQQLDWFHPRQTWFRATRDPGLRMSAAQIAQLGTGKPLFDQRFP